ncbi:hypothetical protein FOZ63_007377, partial [Perkinsus olseni]
LVPQPQLNQARDGNQQDNNKRTVDHVTEEGSTHEHHRVTASLQVLSEGGSSIYMNVEGSGSGGSGGGGGDDSVFLEKTDEQQQEQQQYYPEGVETYTIDPRWSSWAEDNDEEEEENYYEPVGEPIINKQKKNDDDDDQVHLYETPEAINNNIRKQEEEKKRKQEGEEEGEGKKGGPRFSWATVINYLSDTTPKIDDNNHYYVDARSAYRTRPAAASSLKRKKDSITAAAAGFSTKGRELWERVAVSAAATATGMRQLLHANNNYVAENSWQKEE